MIDDIRNAVVDLDVEKTVALAKEAVKSGVSPMEILTKGFGEAMKIVGEKWDSGEYFLMEVLISIHILDKVMEVLKPILKKGEEKIGTMVIGTVKGDLHDIGKDIVMALMRVEGFEVYDLGIDVPASRFVEEVEKVKPDILGLSALLTTTYTYMKVVIDELIKAGLRNQVYVMIGGRPTNDAIAKEFGADAYARDAFEAVKKAKEFIKGGK